MQNRKIKFRVFNTKTKSWIHGPNKISSLDGVNLLGETVLLGGFCDGVNINDLNDLVCLQATGLKDKNDKDIFEGDIVKFHYFSFNGSETDNNDIGQIVYDNVLGAFIIKSINNIDFYFGDTSHFGEPCIEIISNIYDNPNLLKNV